MHFNIISIFNNKISYLGWDGIKIDLGLNLNLFIISYCVICVDKRGLGIFWQFLIMIRHSDFMTVSHIVHKPK